MIDALVAKAAYGVTLADPILTELVRPFLQV